jgi:hypothetical protein
MFRELMKRDGMAMGSGSGVAGMGGTSLQLWNTHEENVTEGNI